MCYADTVINKVERIVVTHLSVVSDVELCRVAALYTVIVTQIEMSLFFSGLTD